MGAGRSGRWWGWATACARDSDSVRDSVRAGAGARFAETVLDYGWRTKLLLLDYGGTLGRGMDPLVLPKLLL